MQVEIWTAFSENPAGGSPAGIVMDAENLDAGEMQAIATRVGVPATGFVTGISRGEVSVRFFSPRTEYGMCGHGTIALLTALVARDLIDVGEIRIQTGHGEGMARVQRDTDGRLVAQLDLAVAPVGPCVDDLSALWDAMGIDARDVAISRSDFVHLLVPMPLTEMVALTPNFVELGHACRDAGIDTVATYSTDTVHADADIHVRDFCPAVGTDEAAATGTTNRAVISHLLAEHPERFETGDHSVVVEQGIELGRPSRIRVEFATDQGQIISLSVGGLASWLEDREL